MSVSERGRPDVDSFHGLLRNLLSDHLFLVIVKTIEVAHALNVNQKLKRS